MLELKIIFILGQVIEIHVCCRSLSDLGMFRSGSHRMQQGEKVDNRKWPWSVDNIYRTPIDMRI